LSKEVAVRGRDLDIKVAMAMSIPKTKINTRGASQSNVFDVQYGLEDIWQDPEVLAPQQIT